MYGPHRHATLRGLSAVLLLALGVANPRALAQPVSAQVSMTVSPDQVAVGEPFRLLIEVKASGSGIEQLSLPDLDRFDILSRQDSSPIQFRFGFGGGPQMVQSTRVHELVLRAREPGRYTLEPARVRVGGQEFHSDPVVVSVTRGEGPPPADMVPNVGHAGASSGIGRVDPQAFLRTVATPTRAYVGQQVTVTLYLYTRQSLRNPPSITREPTANDFWVQDLLPVTRTLDAETQVVQGQRYRVYVLRRFAAFPLHTGELTIDAPEVTLETGSMFGFQASGPIRRTGVPVTVEALPLPAGAPPGTVVGRYDITSELDRSQARTGDAVTLVARVEGTGNLRDVQLTLSPIDGLRILEPHVEDHPTEDDDLLGGTRTVEWLLVVERPGTFTIPGLTLSEVDPETGALSTVRSAPLSLEAVGAPLGAPAQTPATADGHGHAGERMRFGPVRTQSALLRRAQPVRKATWFRVALALPPLLLLGLLLSRFGRRALHMRSRGDRMGTAMRGAKQALRRARAIDGARDPAGFYSEIAHALKTALEGRLGEPIGGLTYAQLRRELLARGMGEALVSRLVDELESCDFARFSAAGSSREELDRTLERAETLVSRIARFAPEQQVAA